MRNTITRGTLTVLAVLLLATQASASPIAIGWLEWLETDPGVGQFSIVNQTGANYQGDPSFPVVDQITFNGDLTLTVVPNGPATLTLNALDNISYDSGQYADPLPTSASLTGTVSPLSVMVDLDGFGGNPATLWNILTGVITDINGATVVLGANGLNFGDLALLYVDAAPARQAVPEPGTMLLIGTGAAALLARRWRARKA